MIRLQDVDLVDTCRYKVGGKGVTPYSGLGFRVRGLVCMVAKLTCYFFDLVIFSDLFSVFSPICYAPQKDFVLFCIIFPLCAMSFMPIRIVWNSLVA